MEENMENVEKKGEGGENAEKPVWYLDFVWEPSDEAMKALAANNIQVDNKVLLDWIPFYSEHIMAVKDTIRLDGRRIKLTDVDTEVSVEILYDEDYNEVSEDFPGKKYRQTFSDGMRHHRARPYSNSVEEYINTAINEFVVKNGRLPSKEETRDAVLSVLKKLQSEVDSKEEHREALMKRAKQWLKKRRKEHEEWLKKKQAEEEEKKRKEEEERQRLLSKPWVKAIYEANEMESLKQKEMQRFKEKYALSDEEIETWDISNKPYIHMEASIDLRPLGISRTVIIRNYASYEGEVDGYAEYFSDLSWMIAEILAKHFNGEIKVYGDHEDYPSTVYLVVQAQGDFLEVASSDVDDP